MREREVVREGGREGRVRDGARKVEIYIDGGGMGLRRGRDIVFVCVCVREREIDGWGERD